MIKLNGFIIFNLKEYEILKTGDSGSSVEITVVALLAVGNFGGRSFGKNKMKKIKTDLKVHFSNLILQPNYHIFFQIVTFVQKIHFKNTCNLNILLIP